MFVCKGGVKGGVDGDGGQSECTDIR